MAKITEEGKYREKRGTGTGANYKPWIKIREINSVGTATTVIDYKNGREVQLLSQGEVWAYYTLRWRDDVEDIREQYPLKRNMVENICDRLGYEYPNHSRTLMTTDLLVTKTDGSLVAYSVKVNRNVLQKARTIQLLDIEKMYWEEQGAVFYMWYKEDANEILVQNIMDVVACYDDKSIVDSISALRYKIAHKEIVVDMESKRLNYEELLDKYRKGELSGK